MTPCSLPNAMTEPGEGDGADEDADEDLDLVDARLDAGEARARGPSAEAKPTSTAAAPTKLCRMATSCGIAVISTRAASTAPMRAADGEHAEPAVRSS